MRTRVIICSDTFPFPTFFNVHHKAREKTIGEVWVHLRSKCNYLSSLLDSCKVPASGDPPVLLNVWRTGPVGLLLLLNGEGCRSTAYNTIHLPSE
jgi:hypothetical protein